MSDEDTSDEWWSVDARSENQGLGRQQTCPIDEHCSFWLGFEQLTRRSNGRMARDIHEPRSRFTDISSVRSRQILQKRSSDQRGRGLQVAEETSIVAFVPSAEAQAVTVAVVPQWASAMLGAVLLTASISASTVE